MGETPDERYGVSGDEVDIERVRLAVLARLCRALRPGGAMVIEDGAMAEFAEQVLPEPFGSIHRIVADAAPMGFFGRTAA